MRMGGQILVDSLLNLGAKCGFCVPGESYLAVLEAFYQVGERFRLISCRHEGGASYMAEAYGKISGMPGLCFVTRGPGASNAMIGVHTAYQDSTPMLLFIGQVAGEVSQREAFQELDYSHVYSGVAKAVIRVDRAVRLPELLGRAWSLSLSGRPGPVVLELPEDMLYGEAEVLDTRPIEIAHASPSIESMRAAVEVLRQAKCPLFVIGGAAWDYDAGFRVGDFAERYGIPVVSAFRRQDSLDNHHPCYIGEMAIAPAAYILETWEQSDCVVLLATRFGDIASGSYQHLAIPYGDKKIVHVFPSAEELHRVYQVDAAVVSTASCFMRALEDYEFARFCSVQEMQALRHAYDSAVANPQHVSGGKLNLGEISHYLRTHLADDSVITAGAGNYTVWGQRYYYYRHFRTCIACSNGSMGYGVPAAIAAKLYNPNKQVVALAGDGCFLMTAQEIATALQHDLPIVILVFNNSSYGTIRSHQEKHYPGHAIATELRNPDFAAYARAFGAFATRVHSSDEFATAFTQATNCGTTAIIELITA